MIYVNAESAQDIARLLRSSQESRRSEGWDDEEKVTIKAITPEPIIITAPRQIGKTTELLRYAEEKHRNSYCVVCLNQEVQGKIILRHRELFNAGNIAKRLNGLKITEPDTNPPLMLTPTNLQLLRGQGRLVFCDEWSLLTEDARRSIIDSGLLVAAVTS